MASIVSLNFDPNTIVPRKMESTVQPGKYLLAIKKVEYIGSRLEISAEVIATMDGAEKGTPFVGAKLPKMTIWLPDTTVADIEASYHLDERQKEKAINGLAGKSRRVAGFMTACGHPLTNSLDVDRCYPMTVVGDLYLEEGRDKDGGGKWPSRNQANGWFHESEWCGPRPGGVQSNPATQTTGSVSSAPRLDEVVDKDDDDLEIGG